MPSSTTASHLRVGHDAWVSVSVATVWRSPDSPRAVDAPSLRKPARIRQWLSGLSIADRLGLIGRADTQALLGDRVVVTGLDGSWARVVVPDQPTPLDPRGYPGWVPLVQLTASPALRSDTAATVVARTTWLRTDDDAVDRVVEVSYGTRLPVISTLDGWVRVGLPGGRALRARSSAVSVTAPGEPALAPRGRDLVRSAQGFTGLPYLWAGASGFGVDCSGLTWLVHRVHGVRIPRDAAPQSEAGRAVPRDELRPGDLLFYGDGEVHHVSVYAGDGLMVHAPSTGRTVETEPVDTGYVVARRFLP
jgi:cell wall-associated NlpC family hydrolase